MNTVNNSQVNPNFCDVPHVQRSRSPFVAGNSQASPDFSDMRYVQGFRLLLVAGNSQASPDFCDSVHWNADGLVPVVAQDADGAVLTLAWMNRQALALSVAESRAVYWSRSRQQLWRKGEISGMTQELLSLWLDCDGDTVLLKVRQCGDGDVACACHTGRHSCFSQRWDRGRETWETAAPVLRAPEQMYGEASEERDDSQTELALT